jgi:hypothetical protein
MPNAVVECARAATALSDCTSEDMRLLCSGLSYQRVGQGVAGARARSNIRFPWFTADDSLGGPVSAFMRLRRKQTRDNRRKK